MEQSMPAFDHAAVRESGESSSSSESTRRSHRSKRSTSTGNSTQPSTATRRSTSVGQLSPTQSQTSMETSPSPGKRKVLKLRNKTPNAIMNELLFLGCAGEAQNGIYYDVVELQHLLIEVKESLLLQPSLLPVGSPVVVVGDLHGSYRSLFNIFELYGWPGEQAYLFLGDYVDRGPRSLEVMTLLLVCSLQHPDSFHLLRGNHETARVNRLYGFRQELVNIYGEKLGHSTWINFNDAMSALPIAGLINGRGLCMHGGLSPHLKTLNDIKEIKRPLHDTRDCPLAHDLMWADPGKADCEGEGMEGKRERCLDKLRRWFNPRSVAHYDENDQRHTSVVFDESEVGRALKRLDIDMIIRAHELQPYGYAFYADRTLLTIFSRPNYGTSRNYGAVAHIDANNQLTLHIMMPLEAIQNPDHRPVVNPDRHPSTVLESKYSTM